MSNNRKAKLFSPLLESPFERMYTLPFVEAVLIPVPVWRDFY